MLLVVSPAVLSRFSFCLGRLPLGPLALEYDGFMCRVVRRHSIPHLAGIYPHSLNALRTNGKISAASGRSDGEERDLLIADVNIMHGRRNRGFVVNRKLGP